MIKIAVAGSNGRMGQEIVKLINEDSNLELVLCLERPTNAKTEQIEPHQKETNSKPNVLIDFSVKEAIEDHVRFCLKENIALVIGVTGLSESEKNIIEKASHSIPILYSPNMSIGVNVSFKILELASKLLRQNADQKTEAAIHEIHHKNKKDAPSGTALRMQEIILSSKLNDTIPITSQRLGEVAGEHKAIFALPGEQLEITHKAEKREIFARGALLAAKWLFQKPAGLYDMQDLFNTP